MNDVLLHFCNLPTPADVTRVIRAFYVAFFVAVICLPHGCLWVMVVSALVACGMRSLAALAADEKCQEMAQINGLAQINRFLAADNIAKIMACFALAILSGFAAALAACASMQSKNNIPHICLTPRFYPAPVLPFA